VSDDVVSACRELWVQQVQGAAQCPGAVIVADEVVLLCNHVDVFMQPAGVLPQDEYPETHGYQNHNENVECPVIHHLIILDWLICFA
jgi:hypothetical protein